VNDLVKKLQTFAFIFANSKAASWLLLCGLFFIVAASAHSGFIAKWGFNDGGARSSFESMVSGKADRPFVYRQLLPLLAKTLQPIIAESNIPSNIKASFLKKFDPQKAFTRAKSANLQGYEYTYRIIYLCNFFALLASLFLLRLILLKAGYSQAEAAIAPSIFILTFPYLQTIGGYFYDSLEFAFFCGFLLLAINGKIVAIILLTAIATLNKESFLFFIPTLYPFLRATFTQKQTVLGIVVAMFLAGLVNVYLKLLYQTNGGGVVEFQLLGNLLNLLNPATYFRLDMTYGIFSPQGLFITTIPIVFIIMLRGAKHVASIWKTHMVIAAVINIPLFFAFCATGELRNLSVLFVVFVLFMAATIKTTITSQPAS
jgi:hypothetical protein